MLLLCKTEHGTVQMNYSNFCKNLFSNTDTPVRGAEFKIRNKFLTILNDCISAINFYKV